MTALVSCPSLTIPLVAVLLPMEPLSSDTEPQPIVMICSNQMPQFVDTPDLLSNEQDDVTAKKTSAVTIYHELRKGFGLSHSQMAEWLGLKRRTLYNWLESQDSCRKKQDVEQRLINLQTLFENMDPEHRPVIFNVATSPINGNPEFGSALARGESVQILLSWYDTLYEQFESLV